MFGCWPLTGILAGQQDVSRASHDVYLLAEQGDGAGLVLGSAPYQMPMAIICLVFRLERGCFFGGLKAESRDLAECEKRKNCCAAV